MPTLNDSGLQFEEEKLQQNVWYEKSKEGTVQDQEQAVTEHGIVYFKQDGQTSVKNEPVDFPKLRWISHNILKKNYGLFLNKSSYIHMSP